MAKEQAMWRKWSFGCATQEQVRELKQVDTSRLSN